MTNLELIFTMLGEEGTRSTAVESDAQGFDENKDTAIEGGEAAGDARRAYEKRTKREVSTRENFKEQISEAKKKKRLD